ncbi:hypothetical protein V2J09_000535 [Rumex salicifolius]
MSSGEARKVSNRDIQVVQNLIEQCIQLHMNRAEAVNTLWSQAKIERHFTELVWQKLEEENREFFEAYNLRLALKDHIVIFNDLLKKHFILMSQFPSAGVPNLPNAGFYLSEAAARTESLKHENLNPDLSHSFNNGVSSLHGSLHTDVDLSVPSGRIDYNTFASQSSDMSLMQQTNGGGGMIKSENDDYTSSSQFMFGVDAPVLEARQTGGDETVASYSALDQSSQGLDDMPFGNLEPITRNFSFSDLTTSYSRSDILQSYSNSPFLGEDHFGDSHERGLQS